MDVCGSVTMLGCMEQLFSRLIDGMGVYGRMWVCYQHVCETMLGSVTMLGCVNQLFSRLVDGTGAMDTPSVGLLQC